MIDRGFELMIPRKKEEPKDYYDYNIKFTLFKKEFVLSFKVKQKPE